MQRRTFLQAAGLSAATMFQGATGSAQAQEDTEMKQQRSTPPFPIVDTHVHFWDTGHLNYPWLKNSELLNRNYLSAEYSAAIKPVEVEKIVFVEAACAEDQKEAEAAWVSNLAKSDPRIQGIVANAPLEQGEAVLPMLERMAADPLLKGIRRFLPSGVKEVSPEFVRGVQLLERVEFSFDIGGGRGLLPAAIKLVRQSPNISFMLNHIGIPDIKNKAYDPWRQEITDLAALPNVCCKVSGVATVADKENWTPADLEPAITHVIDSFGFDRVAFGSDWPVMLSATAFPRWVDALLHSVRGCSDSELRALFRDTAIRFYRLDP